DQKSYILNTVDMGITVLTYATEIVILIVWKDFIWYTASGIIFHILKNFINAFIAQKMYPQYFIKEEDNLPKEEIKSMFKDCGALFIYKINSVVVKATDNLILSTFLGLAMVALYSNYLMFYTTIRSFISRFYTACKASMGNLFATSEVSRQYFFFEVMNFLSVVLFGTACVGVGVVADEFILTWIGESYMIEQPFAILMGIEILLVGIKFNLSQVRQVSGAFRQMWMRPVLGIIINLVVSIALVNVWGIHGVLVGTIAADVLANFMVDPRIIHKSVFKNYKPASDYYKKNLTYFGILAVIEIIDFVICKNFFVGFGWWSVIVHSCICAVSVVGTFLALYWNTEVTKYLWDKSLSILGKKFKKFRRA
ncbi:MAG: hypothetical protein HUJ58_09960, partial [Erysipelotrichaceae bacterium]|nr:hypothetical protein [Erysipelotrichaceae bacterium]